MSEANFARQTPKMPSINFQQIFSLEYIFEKNPPFSSEFLYVVGVFVLLIVLAIFGWIWLGKKSEKLSLYRPLQIRFFNIFFYTGLTGLALSFFRYQQMAYLGSRFFFLILIFFFILFSISLLVYRYKTFSQKLKIHQQKKNFEKYLPRESKGVPRKR